MISIEQADTSMDRYDVVIVGGGPAASCTALFLLARGIQPLIIERESFPRFHIGESLTGEVGGILRELDLECHLQESGYPVKHGVRVYGRGGINSFWVPVMQRCSTGELAPTTTWQVRRDEFDAHLLKTAIQRGAHLVRADADSVIVRDGTVCGVRITTECGQKRQISCRVLVDASGQRTFLAGQRITGPKERGCYEKQVGIFSRVKNAVRDPGSDSGNTLIFYHDKHHWAWFIPVSDDETSIGVVVPGDHFSECGMAPDEFLHWKLQHLNPALTDRLQNIEYTEPVRTASNYSYHIQRFTGPGFLCVGDSHRFIDPIFSFGVFFAANEARMAASAIHRHFSDESDSRGNPFAAYEATVESGQQVIQDLIDFFWEYPLAFQVMAHKTHTEQITDCFAGRVYDSQAPSDAVLTMRRMLANRRASQAVAVN